ncbi:MAG: Crp/Fnr family transcriptional regulator [Bacteroidota bacterium]
MRNWLRVFRQVTIQSFEKREIIIPKGSTKKDVFFIRKGLIRSYFTNEKSEEITFHLFPEYHAFTNVHAVLLDEPSHFTYQALEPTKVYTMDYDSYFQIVANDPEISELNRTFLGKRIMKRAFQRVESFVLLSPEEHYLKYCQDFPSVIDRAPDKYIAHVLGITPVSLSRIR